MPLPNAPSRAQIPPTQKRKVLPMCRVRSVSYVSRRSKELGQRPNSCFLKESILRTPTVTPSRMLAARTKTSRFRKGQFARWIFSARFASNESSKLCAFHCKEDLSERRHSFVARPVALQFTQHLHPAHRTSTGQLHAPKPGIVRDRRSTAHRVDHRIGVVAGLEGREDGEGETHFGPDGGKDHLAALRRFYGGTESRVFPGIERGAIDGCDVGELVGDLANHGFVGTCGDVNRREHGGDTIESCGTGYRGDVAYKLATAHRGDGTH